MATQPSLEEIKFWNVEALKDFLRKRGLKTSGRKEELQALVYSCAELNVPIKPDQVEEDRSRSMQYASLLQINGQLVPDPLTELKSGWVNEKEGVILWPPVSYFEIADWLLNADKPSTSKSLNQRLLSDYKEGKAYSYFDSKWIHDISYHAISDTSTICFLKTKCTPSQAIKSVPHIVWVAADKTTGKLYSAYCSCFAGLGSTCNHVAALIFKLDHAFMTGVSKNQLPCTSKVCKWNVWKGGAGAVLEGKPVSDMKWTKPQYKGEKKPIHTMTKKHFNPLEKTNTTLKTKDLINALYPTCKHSTIFKYLEAEELFESESNFPPEDSLNLGSQEEEVTATAAVPASLVELAEGKGSVEELMASLPKYTDEDIAAVEKITCGQAENAEWEKYRSGLITASNLKSVLTRNKTLKDPQATQKDPVPIIKRLLGYEKVNPNLPAIKYGRLTEPVARREYQKLLRQNGHQNVEVRECGLFIDRHRAFLGASPDALVSCDCCGEGLLEIKCPRSLVQVPPTSANMEALTSNPEVVKQMDLTTELIHGNSKLKQNHQYFYQIQCQLGVTGRSWCDFFVYTKGGFHLERIAFNETLWTEAVDIAEGFFTEFLAPELVTRMLKLQDTPSTSCQDTPMLKRSNQTAPSTPKEPPQSATSSRRNKKKAKLSNTRGGKPVYMCATCGKVCKEMGEFDNDEENSIGCDKCAGWFHWSCQNIVQATTDKWFCSLCSEL